MSDFGNISLQLSSMIDKSDKKKEGIFFTPKKAVKDSLLRVKSYLKKSHLKKRLNILEPSCGSGEFIEGILDIFPQSNIYGIEKSPIVFSMIDGLWGDIVQIINDDYLNLNINDLNIQELKDGYDIIVGNPPYYVMKKIDVTERFYDYFDGRPNIFILFLIKSLSELKRDGILCFILPRNFLNCIYYDKTRWYIYKYFEILDIIECNESFIDTLQETVVFILRRPLRFSFNNIDNARFLIPLKMEKYHIFSLEDNVIKIKDLLEGSTTVNNMGFKVSIGSVVWNQEKKRLSDDNTKTRLIYSSDIEKYELLLKEYGNICKKNYIDMNGMKGPSILVNRGYGVGNYKFEYCLVDIDREYLVENHLIQITIKDNNLCFDEKMKMYNKLIVSFKDERTKQFIDIYFGNNAINATELLNIVPVYI